MSLEPTRKEPEAIGEEFTITKETNIVAKKKKKKKEEFDTFSKNTIGLLRTTLRNNTELTSIADNKANVLLSLNALMLTFFVPLVLPNIDLVQQYKLTIPLMTFVVTCVLTIYIAFFGVASRQVWRSACQFEGRVSTQSFFLWELRENV